MTDKIVNSLLHLHHRLEEIVVRFDFYEHEINTRLSNIEQWLPHIQDIAHERQAAAQAVVDAEVAKNLADQIQQDRQRENEERTYPCAICLDETTLQQLYIVNDCNHRFCSQCILQHVKSQVQAGNVVLQCPYRDGSQPCTAPIDVAQMHELLALNDDPEQVAVLARFDELAFERIMQADPDYIRCPRLLDIPGAEGEIIKTPCPSWGLKKPADSINSASAQCVSCKHLFCPSCHNIPHVGTCEAFAAFLVEHGNNTDEAAYYQYRNQIGVKTCPGCKQDVERNGGCDHMTYVDTIFFIFIFKFCISNLSFFIAVGVGYNFATNVVASIPLRAAAPSIIVQNVCKEPGHPRCLCPNRYLFTRCRMSRQYNKPGKNGKTRTMIIKFKHTKKRMVSAHQKRILLN